MSLSQIKKGSPFFRGLHDGIPICMGYLFVATTLGIAAAAAGLNPWEAGLMSFTMHASAGEFAAINLIALGGSYAEMALTELVINLRYLLMSCSLSQKLPRETGIGKRLLLAYGITDEIFALSATYPGKLPPSYSLGLFCIASPGWVGGTVFGALLGNLLPDNITQVMSLALYCMFLSIIIPAAKQDRFMAGLIVISMLAGTLCTYLPFLRGLSSGMRVMILTLILSAAAAVIRPHDDSAEVSSHES